MTKSDPILSHDLVLYHRNYSVLVLLLFWRRQPSIIADVLFVAESVLHQWRNAQRVPSSVPSVQKGAHVDYSRWLAPPRGMRNANVDVVVFTY